MTGNSKRPKTFIIAEAGVNHNGDLNKAEELIRVAADAGADAVKFQAFQAAKLVTPDARKADYQIKNTQNEDSQWEMLKALELDAEQHLHLRDYSRQFDIEFLSSPFDVDSMAMLKSLGMKIGKIPSGEIVNLRYLQAMPKHFEKIILSTGMCNLAEILKALEVLRDAGADRESIQILHCNTEYPTPMHDVNLRAMHTIAEATGMPVGLSDHSIGIEVPVAAVALGAVTIEKHFTLDKNMPGPDHACSLEPQELKAMVSAIRNIEIAMGNPGKIPTDSEERNRPIARKSLHFIQSKKAGERILEEDLIAVRPGDGISPMLIDQYIGRKLIKDVEPYDALKENILD